MKIKNLILLILILNLFFLINKNVDAVICQGGICTIRNENVDCNGDLKDKIGQLSTNLIISSGGSITTSSATTCTISVTGDVTIESNGIIRGNVDIINAQTIKIEGNIDATGKGYLHGVRNGKYEVYCCPSVSSDPLGNNFPYARGCSGGGFVGDGGFGCKYSKCDVAILSTGSKAISSPYSYGTGGGDRDSLTSCSDQSNIYAFGGDGGGKINLKSNTLLIKGGIIANGGDGTALGSDGKYHSYAGGGGSGGSISITTNKFIITDSNAKIEAIGGDGGLGRYSTVNKACGGGGSGGYINIKYSDGNEKGEIEGILDVNGGSPGSTEFVCTNGGPGKPFVTKSSTTLGLTLSENQIVLKPSETRTITLGIKNNGYETANDVNITNSKGTPACSGVNVIAPSDSSISIGAQAEVSSTLTITSTNAKSQECVINIEVSSSNAPQATKSLAVEVLPDIKFELDPLKRTKTVLSNTISTLPEITIKNKGSTLDFKIEELDDNGNPTGYLAFTNLIEGKIKSANFGNWPIKADIKKIASRTNPYITNVVVTPCRVQSPGQLEKCYTDPTFVKKTKIELTVIDLNVLAYPNERSPYLYDPLKNEPIQIIVEVFLGESISQNNKTQYITFKNLTINGKSCSALRSLSQQKNILFCDAPKPALKDGRFYDLDVSFDYEEGINKINDLGKKELKAIQYKDITKPRIFVIPPTYRDTKIKLETIDNVKVTQLTSTLQSPDLNINDLTFIETSSGLNNDEDLKQTWEADFSINEQDRGRIHKIIVTAKDAFENTEIEYAYPTFAPTFLFKGDLKDVDDLIKGKLAGFNLYSLISQGTYLFSSSLPLGSYSKEIDQGNYEITIKNSKEPLDNADLIIYHNVEINKDQVDKIKFFGDSPSIVQDLPLDTSRTKTLAIRSDYDYSYSKTISFNYKNLLETLKLDISKLRIIHCPNWDFDIKECLAFDEDGNSWIEYDTEDGMIINETSYTASLEFEAEDKIGAFALIEECPECGFIHKPIIIPPILPPIYTNITYPDINVTVINNVATLDTEEFKIEMTLIEANLYPAQKAEYELRFTNKLSEDLEFKINKYEEASEFIDFKKDDQSINEIKVSGFGYDEARILVDIPNNAKTGRYNGEVIIEVPGLKKEVNFPFAININELDENEQFLNIDVDFITITSEGDILIETKLDSKGKFEKTEAFIDYSVNDALGNIVAQDSEVIDFLVSRNVIKTITPEKKLSQGRYLLEASALYGNYINQTISATESFEVKKPFFQNLLLNLKTKKILGISLLTYILFLILAGLIFAGIIYYRKKLELERLKKRKFQVDVDFNTLPKPGLRSSFIGKIAETNVQAYINLDMLKLHTIVAGSTGSGKTVTAQILCEGALMRGIDIVVFDPSAQWTGFLRKCEEHSMLQFYPEFSMPLHSSRKFLGRVKVIEDPREIVNLKDALKRTDSKKGREGNITIVCLNKLEPKDIDLFVANTIREIFEINPQESEKLKLLLVYDEVHRLLEKFGGKGAGFVQIERGLREFRKWGIGMVLISQVLSDFVGEIKANISTEIQMRTRYEGDLSRLKEKYGEIISNTLIRSPVGTGMVVNAEYNKGRPYFFLARPLLHRVKRLEDNELELHNKYNKKVEDLIYKIGLLKKYRFNVSNVEPYANLAMLKLVEEEFNIVDEYVDKVIMKINNALAKIPKAELQKPALIKEEAIKKSVEEANAERSKYIELESPFKELRLVYSEVVKKLGENKNTLLLKMELEKIEKLIILLRSNWDNTKVQLLKQRIMHIKNLIKKYL